MWRVILVKIILISVFTSFLIALDSINSKTFSVSSLTEIEDMNLNFCKSFSLEFTSLYSITDTLPNRWDDSTLVKSLLITNGFEQTDYGSGYWLNGPRFTRLDFQKDSCKCTTLKIYYFNELIDEENYNMRIVERIICNTNQEIKID